jgi:hypothetical protein
MLAAISLALCGCFSRTVERNATFPASQTSTPSPLLLQCKPQASIS